MAMRTFKIAVKKEEGWRYGFAPSENSVVINTGFVSTVALAPYPACGTHRTDNYKEEVSEVMMSNGETLFIMAHPNDFVDP